MYTQMNNGDGKHVGLLPPVRAVAGHAAHSHENSIMQTLPYHWHKQAGHYPFSLKGKFCYNPSNTQKHNANEPFVNSKLHLF